MQPVWFVMNLHIQEISIRMKIFGYELRKEQKTEQRNITIGPSTPLGLPYSGTGTSLSAENSMKLSAVYRCVDVKSSDIGAMPWDVFIYRGNLEWVKDDSHFSYSMLNIQPNPSCSSFSFWKTFTAKVELNGNGFARIMRDDMGNPFQLILLTGAVTMYLRNDNSVFYVHQHPYTQEEEFIDGEDMIHVLNFSYDGL